jgi:hypothetical protein
LPKPHNWLADCQITGWKATWAAIDTKNNMFKTTKLQQMPQIPPDTTIERPSVRIEVNLSDLEIYGSDGSCLIHRNHILETANQFKELLDGDAVANHLVHFEDQ